MFLDIGILETMSAITYFDVLLGKKTHLISPTKSAYQHLLFNFLQYIPYLLLQAILKFNLDAMTIDKRNRKALFMYQLRYTMNTSFLLL